MAKGKGIILEFDVIMSQIDELLGEMQELIDLNHRLSLKPKNIVLDTWVYYQPLINGKTLVWYYCDVLEKIRTKII